MILFFETDSHKRAAAKWRSCSAVLVQKGSAEMPSIYAVEGSDEVQILRAAREMRIYCPYPQYRWGKRPEIEPDARRMLRA